VSILDGGGAAAVVLETTGARETTVLTGTCPNTTGEGAVDTLGEGATDALGEPAAGFLTAVSGIAG
jgi:hypothetical protein